MPEEFSAFSLLSGNVKITNSMNLELRYLYSHLLSPVAARRLSFVSFLSSLENTFINACAIDTPQLLYLRTFSREILMSRFMHFFRNFFVTEKLNSANFYAFWCMTLGCPFSLFPVLASPSPSSYEPFLPDLTLTSSLIRPLFFAQVLLLRKALLTHHMRASTLLLLL